MIMRRFATVLTAIWVGLMVGVGYLFAPILFKMMTAERQFAGLIAGEAFEAIAYVSLVLGVIIMLIIKFEHKRSGLAKPSPELYLILVAVGLAVIGHFIITPEIVLAKSGVQTALSFGALHLLSQVVYVTQILLLLALSWRLSKPLPQESSSGPR